MSEQSRPGAVGGGLRDFTLWNAISANASRFGDKTAFVSDDQSLSHLGFMARSESAAAKLLALGIGQGDRVALMAENTISSFILIGACARIGAISVPINWRLAPAEVSAILSDCAPSMLVSDPATSAAADKAVGEAGLGTPSSDLSTLVEQTDEKDSSLLLPSPPKQDDALLLIYTAAIDGQARGATISHGNLVAASAQIDLAVGLAPDDIFLANLPLFHIMGTGFALAVLLAGGTIVVCPRFDATDAAAAIERYGVTTIGSFPPMLAAVLDAADAGAGDLASLRRCIGLEMPATIERLEGRWPNARFWTGYGQTETTGMVTIGQASEAPGACGAPGRFSQVSITDHRGIMRAPGQTGQIVVRGPVVMHGYWRRESENEAVFAGGWHHTGDLGNIGVDGLLRYSGRTPAKMLIKTGGENVYPGEVERALRQHPDVIDVAVFGVPDAHWGEAVAAVVVMRADAAKAADKLSKFLEGRLARYKRPSRWAFDKRIPQDEQGFPDQDQLVRLVGDGSGKGD